MRGTASRLPVTIPGKVVRSTMERLVRQREYPSASAASRSELGTSLIISSVVRSTIGIMSMASAALPARAEKCFWVATIQAQAKTPTTIEGVRFITSATKGGAQGRARGGPVDHVGDEAGEPGEAAGGELGAVDARGDADRQSHQAGDADNEQGADD